jgi:L-lactate dehydrogenase
VREAAYEIIAGKGATYYGIGGAITHIIDVLEHDHSAILTVCSPIDELAGVEDVTLSMPFLLNGSGVQDCLPLELNSIEREALRQSGLIIRGAIESLSNKD